MRIKSSGVAIAILSQSIILNPYSIDNLHNFIEKYDFGDNRIYFAIDEGGQLYCYNHQPMAYLHQSQWACSNRDDHHCNSMMHLDIEWYMDAEWKIAATSYPVEQIKRMIAEYYEQNGNDE